MVLHKEIQKEEHNSLKSHGNQVLSNKVPLKGIRNTLLTFGERKGCEILLKNPTTPQNKKHNHNELLYFICS